MTHLIQLLKTLTLSSLWHKFMSVLTAAFSNGQPVSAIYNQGQLIYQAGSGPYSPEATALFARMDEQLDDDDKVFINDWLARAAPHLARMDVFYVSCFDRLTQCTEDGKLINWCNTLYNGTLNGTVNYLANKGLKGDGTSFFIDTGFLPTKPGAKYSTNSAHFGSVISDTNGTTITPSRSIGGYFGTNGGTRFSFNNNGTNLTNTRLNRNAARSMTYGTLIPAHIMMTLDPATSTVKVFKDVAILDTNVITPVDTSLWTTGAFRFMAWFDANNPTVPNGYGSQAGSAFYCGGYFTDDQTLDWFYTLNELLAYFGAEAAVPRPYAFTKISMTPGNLTPSNVITYTLAMRSSGTRNGHLDINVEGALTDADFNTPFLTSLGAAVASTTGVSLSGNTLTFDSTFVGPLVWNRTLTASKPGGTVHSVRLTNEVNLYIEGPFCAQICGTVVPPAAPTYMKGANLSGGEFGTAFYFNDAQIAPYQALGCNTIRLPALWQRMQPVLFGPLTTTGQAAQYKAGALAITNRNMWCIIEPHNYGNFDNGNFKIGTPEVPVASIVDFWEKWVDYMGPNPYLIYNLMNEPSGMDGDTWRSAAKAITDAIRAKGYNNQILVPGTAFTGAWSWVSSGNAARFLDFTDPVNNYIFDMHQYLDAGSDGSGTDAGTCSIDSHTRLDAAIGWCRTNGRKFMLGEYAAGDPSVVTQEQCAIEFPEFLDIMYSNNLDVIAGGTVWGAGPYWNSTYVFRFFNAVGTNVLTWLGGQVSARWTT